MMTEEEHKKAVRDFIDKKTDDYINRVVKEIEQHLDNQDNKALERFKGMKD